MASPQVRVETAKGRCPEHGLVEGRREIPNARAYGPVSHVVRRLQERAAARAPFVCPQCDRDIELEGYNQADRSCRRLALPLQLNGGRR
jgi:hypothetical protein